jgi:NAD(P)-dependent dehydrogenase (short-subunit alcohol dehydrogenase family)
MPAETRMATFEINFHTPVDLIQQALHSMLTADWGRIVKVSSQTTQQPPISHPGPARFIHALTVYGATKAALDRYTLGLAAELQGSGIGVNALRPYKIALTEGARETARAFALRHPDYIEPVEMMAEACYRLVSGTFTGLAVGSRSLLQQLQAPLHTLDGHTIIGDALTLAQIE